MILNYKRFPWQSTKNCVKPYSARIVLTILYTNQMPPKKAKKIDEQSEEEIESDNGGDSDSKSSNEDDKVDENDYEPEEKDE